MGLDIEVYGRPNCIWCDKAVEFLDTCKLDYTYDKVTQMIIKETGAKTVPVIIINGEYIGGFQQLKDWYAEYMGNI